MASPWKIKLCLYLTALMCIVWHSLTSQITIKGVVDRVWGQGWWKGGILRVDIQRHMGCWRLNALEVAPPCCTVGWIKKMLESFSLANYTDGLIVSKRRMEDNWPWWWQMRANCFYSSFLLCPSDVCLWYLSTPIVQFWRGGQWERVKS